MLSVAPYTGAWIEIYDRSGVGVNKIVAPYTGAWIEITKSASALA